MNQRSVISIIVPIYRSEAFLEECIQSLINQTYPFIEIILVNDGSPDNSGRICDAFARERANIRVIHKENSGAADALNTGTFASTGCFFMYVDADDWLEPDTCETAINRIVESDSDIAIWSCFNEFPNKSVIAPLEYDSVQIMEGAELQTLRKRMIGLTGRQLKNPVKTDALSSGRGKLYKRNLITPETEYWVDTRIVGSSDVFFNVQVFCRARRIIYINKHLYHYRRGNPYSLTKTYGSTLHVKLKNLFARISDFLGVDTDHDFSRALQNRIALSTINITLSLATSNNRDPFWKRIGCLNSVLYDDIFGMALKQLDLRYMPFYWKVFFLASRYRLKYLVFFLGKMMVMLRKRVS